MQAEVWPLTGVIQQEPPWSSPRAGTARQAFYAATSLCGSPRSLFGKINTGLVLSHSASSLFGCESA